MNALVLSARLLAGVQLRRGYLSGSLTLHTVRREPCAPLVLLGRKFQRTTSLGWLEWTTHNYFQIRDNPEGREASLEHLFTLLRGWGVRGLTQTPRRWRDYRYTARGENGVLLAWGRADDRAASVHICLPQSQLETMPLSVQRTVLEWICRRPFTATRVDLAVDDKTRITKLENIRDAITTGRVMMRSKKNPQPHYDHGRGSSPVLTGYSFGSRQSDTFLRVYDKTIEQMRKRHEYLASIRRNLGSDEEREAVERECKRVADECAGLGIRYELELHDERAWSALAMLAGSEPAAWDGLATGLLRGNLDFRDTSANQNISRCPMLDWWRDFVTTTEAVTISSEKPALSVERFLGFMRRQLAPSLALLAEFSRATGGSEWLRDLLRAGKERYSERHRMLSQLIHAEASQYRINTPGSVIERLRETAGFAEDAPEV